MVWDESLFIELSDLNPWLNVNELNGNFLTNDFLIKYSSKLYLTQELFRKVKWTMPLIFSMGWENIFFQQFEIRNHDFDYLGNISQDVFIHYYPFLFKDYIDSNFELEMEVILSDLDNLKYLNKSLVSKLCEKVGNLISLHLHQNRSN